MPSVAEAQPPLPAVLEDAVPFQRRTAVRALLIYICAIAIAYRMPASSLLIERVRSVVLLPFALAKLALARLAVATTGLLV